MNADGVGAASASTPVAFAPFTFYEMNPCGGNWGGQDLRVLTGGTDFGQSTFNTFGIFRGGLQQVYLGFSGPGDYCFYFFAEATAVGCELPPLTVGTGVTRKDWDSVSPPVTSQTGETWTLEQTGSVTLNTRPYSLATTLEYTSPNAFVDVHHVLTTPDVSSLQRTTDDTVTSGSTAMTVTSGTGIRVGMCVAGTGIASGTVVKAISGTSVTLDRSATANVTGGTATFSACAKIYQSSDMYLDGSDFGPGDDTLIGGNRLVAQVTPSSQLNPGVVNGGVGGILEVTGYPFTSWAEALFQCVFGSTPAAQSECADVPWGANYGGSWPNSVDDSVTQDAGTAAEWSVNANGASGAHEVRTRIFFAAGIPTLSGVYDDTQARIGDTVNLRLLLGNAPQWSWQSAAFQLDLPPNTTLGTPTTSCSSAIVSIVSRTLSFTNGSLSTANLSCPVTVPVTFTSAGLYSTTTQDASAYVIRDTGTLTQRPLGVSVNASVEVQAEAIFNANSGVGAMPPQLSAVAANLIPNTFTRDGFTFAGWNTAANGSGAPYGDGAVFPFTVDDTLYAQWRSVTPPPVYPPGAPLDVQASAGDGSATVTWTAPSYAGSFPITDYRVTSFPGGQSCLVEAPATSCTVSGLTNGTTYTFTVEALNGAGWGEPSLPSNAVTPSAGVVRLVLNQGVRFADGRNDRIRTTGSSVGIPDGSRLTPYIKYTGSDEYKRGKATIVVKADGTYTWTRKIRKNRGVTAYVQWLDVRSNTVFWAKLT